MDSMTEETFIERVKARNPFYDRIEFLSEFKNLTSNITFRCKKHNFEKTCIARNLTKAISCPECLKEIPKKECSRAEVGDKFGMLTVLYDTTPYISPKGRSCRASIVQSHSFSHSS